MDTTNVLDQKKNSIFIWVKGICGNHRFFNKNFFD